jgi:hypothetical protein
MAKASKAAKATKAVVLFPTSVKFTPAIKAALDKAAAADARSVSSLLQKIVSEWLKAQGFLK